MARWLLDAGHAKNTWPPSKGVYTESGSFAEHNFNYAVAMYVKKWAESLGFEIVMSQESYEKDLGLVARVQRRIKPMHVAKKFDGLISFHANASNDKSASGHGVFHYFNSANSKRLAVMWDKYADNILDIPNWGKSGVWQSLKTGWTRMYILWATPMPAILLEHFFFTNPTELKHCDTIEFVQSCAEVSVRTMCEYSGVEFKFMPTAIMDNKEENLEVFEELIDKLREMYLNR